MTHALALGHNAIYVDSKGHRKVALIIGTAESIVEGSALPTIPDDHFNIIVTSPSGRQYLKASVPSAVVVKDNQDYYNVDKNLVSVLYPLDAEIKLNAPTPSTEDVLSAAGAVMIVVSVDEAPKTDENGYTHTAGDPVTDPEGSVIDIDGETFVIGNSNDENTGTVFGLPAPLANYDYTLIKKAEGK